MPKGKPREGNRKDIWLTKADMQNVATIIELMKFQGIRPARGNDYSLSEVVRFAMDRIVRIL